MSIISDKIFYNHQEFDNFKNMNFHQKVHLMSGPEWARIEQEKQLQDEENLKKWFTSKRNAEELRRVLALPHAFPHVVSDITGYQNLSNPGVVQIALYVTWNEGPHYEVFLGTGETKTSTMHKVCAEVVHTVLEKRDAAPFEIEVED